MTRAAFIFVFILIMIVASVSYTITTGFFSGELKTKVIAPLQTAAQQFAEQAAKIPDTTSVQQLPTPDASALTVSASRARKIAFGKATNTAYLSFAKGDFQAVIASGSSALDFADTNEDKAIAHYWIGLGYYRSGNQSKAWQEINLAITLNKNYAAPYTTLSALSMDKGDYIAGLKLAQAAAMLDPTYPWAYNNQGIALIQMGRKEEGIEMFRKAVKLAPDMYVFQDNLTRALNVK